MLPTDPATVATLRVVIVLALFVLIVWSGVVGMLWQRRALRAEATAAELREQLRERREMNANYD